MDFRLSRNAIHYTLEQLIIISGLRIQVNDANVDIDNDHSTITIQVSDNKKIIIKLMNENDISNLFQKKLLFKRIPSFDGNNLIPAFFTSPDEEFATYSNGEVHINADIITMSFIMLSRIEEMYVKERDNHSRFKFQSSLSYFYDFIHIPIVDEYAMLIKKWLQIYYPGLEAENHKTKILPTHDIDMLLRFGNIFRNIETIVAGDIISNKSISLAVRSFKQCMLFYKDRTKDPLIQSICDLTTISKNHGLQSTFYFKGLVEGQYDCTYDVFLPEVKYCMDMVKENGMAVGMHAGYNTCNDIDKFRKQKENLEYVNNASIDSNRQHFLQFDINSSVDIWEKCGITKDSTLAYAEHEGFRCGTSHAYPLFNLKSDSKSKVIEIPLIVMESSLFYHQKLDVNHAFNVFMTLYERCIAMNGNFTFLWHNHYMIRNYEKYFNAVYLRFMDQISK